MFDDDFASRVARHRTSTRFGLGLELLAETHSTNDDASRRAADGAPEGLVIAAYRQRGGRGRLGRTWQSPPGTGLYFSTIVRPPPDARGQRETSFLTLAAGVAVADAIEAVCGLRCALKWPNDVVVSRGSDPTGGWRRAKLCGILAEATSGAGLHHVVVGMGVNVSPDAVVNHLVPPATSIEGEVGRKVDAAELLARCLTHLEIEVDALRTSPLAVADLLERWRGRARASFGRAVAWDAADGPREGRTIDVDADGALTVATPLGVERVISGEVRWR